MREEILRLAGTSVFAFCALFLSGGFIVGDRPDESDDNFRGRFRSRREGVLGRAETDDDATTCMHNYFKTAMI